MLSDSENDRKIETSGYCPIFALYQFIAVALNPMPHKTLHEIGGTIGAVAGYSVSETVLRHRK